MGKLLISLTDEVERRLRETAKKKYGEKRGALSIAVEAGIKLWLEKEG